MGEKLTVIDMHKHGFEKVEFERANLNPYQYIRSLLANAQIYDVKIQTSAGGHNSTLWGKAVYELYNKIANQYPEIRDDLEILPQSEFNVDIGNILTYTDSYFGGEKYVFKKLHFLVAPKKGMENEFFEKTDVYSRWTEMFIKKSDPKLINDGKFPKTNAEFQNDYVYMGAILKASRNILCKKYCNNANRIPFDVYKNTTTRGLSYEEIRNLFVQDSFEYLVSQNLIENTPEAKEQISKDIERFTEFKYGKADPINMFLKTPDMIAQNQELLEDPTILLRRKVHHALSRLQLCDIKLLFGDTSYICVAHPNTIGIRNHSGLPASAFENVDISSLPKEVQDEIEKKLDLYHLSGFDYIFTIYDKTNVLVSKELPKTPFDSEPRTEIFINGDAKGIVKDEIVIRKLDEFTEKLGFKVDAYEISPTMFADGDPSEKKSAWQHVELYSKYGKAINCNSSLGDVHMNENYDLGLIDKAKSYRKYQRNLKNSTFYCTHCSWVDLIKDGTFNPETQTIEVKVLSDKFDKKTVVYKEDPIEKQ